MVIMMITIAMIMTMIMMTIITKTMITMTIITKTMITLTPTQMAMIKKPIPGGVNSGDECPRTFSIRSRVKPGGILIIIVVMLLC